MSSGVAHRAVVVPLSRAGRLAAWAGCAAAILSASASAQRALPINRSVVETRQRDAARFADASRRAIHFCAGSINTDAPAEPLLAALADPAQAGRMRVIQLDGPMTPARRERLEDAGVRLGSYLPTDAWYADFSHADPARLARLPFIRWNAAIDPAWKLDPSIGTRSFSAPERQRLANQGDVVVVVALHKDCADDELREAVARIPGASVRSESTVDSAKMLSVIAPMGSLPALADLDSVEFIEEALEATPRNNGTRWILQSNQLNVTPLYANALTGAGQVLGFIDGLPDLNHCSFVQSGVAYGPAHRKIIAFNAPGTTGNNGHGTHTLGSAVGDAGAFDDRRGVAYSAKAVISDDPSFVQEGFLSTTLALHHSQGARVHTNSWGADFSTTYNAWCREIDAFTWENEDDMIVFAVTNFSVVYVPENAKNVLAVAACGDFPDQENVASGGSGPTADGRRKPEVYAPGGSIASSAGNTACGLLTLTGTSMAAPAVSGVAMLMRQYFTEGMYPTGARVPANAFTPTGALLRAMLVNSSANMTGPGLTGYPGLREGWGRVLADNSLFFAGDARKLLVWDVRNTSAKALSTGQVRAHKFVVSDSNAGGQLRVTMAFSDAPAALGAAYAPINNISLEVTSPTGVVYRGNAFGVLESDAGGRAEPSSDFDPRNTIEQVHVSTPEAGAWTVRILGEAVNVGTQGYALVVTGGVAASLPCAADLTGDGLVDSADLSQFLAAWGPAPGHPADFNSDGFVNSADLPVLLSTWGPCP